MELTWCPLRLEDARPLAGLFAAAELVEPTGEHYSADDLREELDDPNIDLVDATTAAWDGDRLVACGLIKHRDAANPAHMARVEFLVHPHYRDEAMARHLTGWLLRTGKLVHARTFPDAPLELHASADENQRWFTGVLEAAGYRHARTFVEMRTDLALSPVPALPPEFALEGFQQKYDEVTRRACNATFAHHWGSTVRSPAAWRHQVTGNKDFRPDLSFLLLSPTREEVVAFVLSWFFASDAAATGVRELYVGDVGTSAELRGRGLATALLAHTLAEAKAAGFERSSLNVDLDNANRALSIYERCGYRVSRRRSAYVLPVAR